SIFIALFFSKVKTNEKLLLSWVGLRGAVPIILATFPLLVNLPGSEMIFNIVFFIVLTSIFLQGTSIRYVSKLLKVEGPATQKQTFPIEFEKRGGIDADLEEVIIPYNASAVGQRLFEIGVPDECLVVLVCRDGNFYVPNGATVIDGGDVLQVLGKMAAIKQFEQSLHQKRNPAES
ncbi:MAG: cation:proton antiporter, partial [Candidatus Omnitrophica bacterium]|nr:cation:proton antiporter [Candidatus Omnitrophota bacterium]